MIQSPDEVFNEGREDSITKYGRFYKPEVLHVNTKGDPLFTQRRRAAEELRERKLQQQADPLFELLEF